jgi:hypothetical protein
MTPAPPEWLEAAIDEQAKMAAPDSIRVGDIYKSVAFKEGDRQQWHVTLDGGGCIHLSAAGDQTVEEISLFLWDPSGKRLETVRGKTPRTVLHHCPPPGARGAYKFEAKITEGHGHYAVGLYAQGDPGAAAKGGSAEKPAAKPSAKPAEKADLDGRMTKLAKTSAAGSAIVGEPFKGSANSTDWYVALEKGNCYWFVGAGDDSIDKLNLYLWDPDDKRVKASKAETNEVTVGHCPDGSGMFHFRAQVNGGEGKYQVGLYAKKK